MLSAGFFGQQIVLDEPWGLVLDFLPLLAQPFGTSGPLSLVGRHHYLRARKSLKVEMFRLFSSLLKYCYVHVNILNKAYFCVKGVLVYK